MEVQTLRYYLSLFSVFIFIFLIFYTSTYPILLKDKIIKINKGDSINKISNLVFEDRNYLKIKYFKYILYLCDKYFSKVNYGKFSLKKNSNYIDIIKIISTKSNVNYKLTIIEGWQNYQLNNYLSKFYHTDININYNEMLADTYLINSSNSLEDFKNFTQSIMKDFFYKYQSNVKLKKYGLNNILIISSLIEKEGQNEIDKNLIASVIFNRLNLNKKLEIDATVIFSLTEGKNKFIRKLTLKDLKFKHPYNTYIIKSLPPGMISYVSPKTIEIVLESTKSDFLFYFYNIIQKKHIFSKNYKEHLIKLNEYRKKTK